ncbi:hypothetical protein Tco_0897509 [Tanacetum coccineum]
MTVGHGRAIVTVEAKKMGSNLDGSRMLMEEKEIVKLVEEEEMADLELHVCGNVIDQEDLYKFDEEALALSWKKNSANAKCYAIYFIKSLSEGGGALGANKAITHPVITIFLYPLGTIEATSALEVDVIRALDLMEVEAMGALDLVEVEAVRALDLVEVGAVGSLSSSSSLEI